jgi:hypothetical protein
MGMIDLHFAHPQPFLTLIMEPYALVNDSITFSKSKAGFSMSVITEWDNGISSAIRVTAAGYVVRRRFLDNWERYDWVGAGEMGSHADPPALSASCLATYASRAFSIRCCLFSACRLVCRGDWMR